ncbi:MAG TPA: hypothetical protein VG737_03275 [Cyclobacteriaceae bacterium]|nr:hypothetical protein [Cyclobacteriaceae bacterium]
MKKSMVWMLVLFPVFVFAQKQEDGQELIEKFFEHYQTNGPNDAMMYALTTNKWLGDGDVAHHSPFYKLGKITSHLGKFTGVEEISVKMVGSRVKIANYMVYYEMQPLLLTFELYNNNGTWEFADVQYEKRLEKMLATSSLHF